MKKNSPNKCHRIACNQWSYFIRATGRLGQGPISSPTSTHQNLSSLPFTRKVFLALFSGLLCLAFHNRERDWLRLIWSAGRHINSFSAGNWTSRWERRRDNVRRLLIHIRVRSMKITSNTFFFTSQRPRTASKKNYILINESVDGDADWRQSS